MTLGLSTESYSQLHRLKFTNGLEREDISELTRKVLHSVRSQVFSDWLEVYDVCGIENGEERMGNSVLLLTSVVVSADIRIDLLTFAASEQIGLV
jgi:hypothetical protein